MAKEKRKVTTLYVLDSTAKILDSAYLNAQAAKCEKILKYNYIDQIIYLGIAEFKKRARYED